MPNRKPDAVQDAAPDAPDIRIDTYTVPGITVTWTEGDDGVTSITFSGSHTVTVTETPGADGPLWTSPAFRGKKPSSAKDAMKAALVNSITTAFLDAWRVAYPPEKPTKAYLELEIIRRQKQIDAMNDLIERAAAEHGIRAS